MEIKRNAAYRPIAEAMALQQPRVKAAEGVPERGVTISKHIELRQQRHNKRHMTHSYRLHFFHLIWSTKQRLPLITPDIQARLYPYLGGIVIEHSGKLIEIGGMPDHVHLLIELSNLDNFSSFIRDLKASSSLWIKKNYPGHTDFAWQEGYGSFSVSFSSIEQVRKYILNQEMHHATMSFDEEYKKLLMLHQVKFDERFVLG